MEKKRENPTYVTMGIEKEMLLRLDRPLKSELRHLYKLVYRGLPAPGFGQFVSFCAYLGMDVVRDRYLEKKAPPAED